MIFYVVFLFIFLILYLLLFAYLFKNKGTLAKNFSLFSLANIVYIFGTIGIMFTKDLNTALIFQKVKYFGAVFLTPTIILFLLNITYGKINKNYLFPLYLIPVIILIFITTNESHLLYYKTYDINSLGAFTVFTHTPGPIYYLHGGLVFSAKILIFYLIYRLYNHKTRAYVVLSILLIINLFFGTALDILYLTNTFPKGIDITIFVNIFQIAIYILAIFYYKILKPYEFSNTIIPILNIGVIVLDKNHNLKYNNKYATNYFTWLNDYSIGDSLLKSDLKEYLKDDLSFFVVEKEINNKIKYLEFNKANVNVPDSNEIYYAYIFNDATERNLLKQQLKQMIKLDALTNIYNQGAILAKVEEKYNYAKEHNYTLATSIIDINDFKRINDKYGHLAGNKVIVEIANKIKEVFSCGRCIYGRFGGDEFVMSTYNVTEEQYKKRMAQFSKSLKIYQEELLNEMDITISIGTCFVDFNNYKGDAKYTDLINLADQAMYESKKTKTAKPIFKTLK